MCVHACSFDILICIEQGSGETLAPLMESPSTNSLLLAGSHDQAPTNQLLSFDRHNNLQYFHYLTLPFILQLFLALLLQLSFTLTL